MEKGLTRVWDWVHETLLRVHSWQTKVLQALFEMESGRLEAMVVWMRMDYIGSYI